MSIRGIGTLGAVLVALSSMVSPTMAACPSPDQLLETLDDLQLERASRTKSFENAVPTELYQSAVDRVGEVFVSRSGLKGFGVLIVELPIEKLWKAVNDEDHHDLEGDYIPVKHSEVIGGDPRGSERLLFQTFQRWGIGRWWLSRIRMSADLYRQSDGNLWELTWTDEIDSADTENPPIADVAKKMPALKSSRGSWLMIPLSEDCTAVEYFTHTEPGGFIGLGQRMVAKRGVHLTFEGLLNLVSDHISEHDVRDFFLPDGAGLGWSSEEKTPPQAAPEAQTLPEANKKQELSAPSSAPKATSQRK